MRLFKVGDFEIAFIENDMIPEETLVKYWKEARNLYKQQEQFNNSYNEWLYNNKSKVEKLKRVALEAVNLVTKGDTRKSDDIMYFLIKRMYVNYAKPKFKWTSDYFSEILYSHNIEHKLINSGRQIIIADEDEVDA